MNNENPHNEAKNAIEKIIADFEFFVTQEKATISNQISEIEEQLEAITTIESEANRSKKNLLKFKKNF
ncbi:MAG: hypothetical protein ACOYB1_12210 [Limnohabitans sp.]